MALDRVTTEFLGTEAPTDADYNAKIGGMLATNDSLETENQSLKEELAELRKLKPNAELGEKYMTDTRAAALKAFRAARGDKASEAMIKTIETANLDTALALQTEFEAEVERKFPLKCESCGAESLSRRSSMEEAGNPDENPQPQGNVDSYKTTK